MLTPYEIMENVSVARVIVWLETGEYPRGEYSLTWDILAYCDYCKKKDIK